MTPKKPFDPALREELIAMTERGQMTNYECWKIIHDFYMQTHATMNQEEIDVIS